MAERRRIQMKVNGMEMEGDVEPRRLLSDFLREDLQLKGTHVGCEHGICGVCTVLMNGEPVRSCLVFAVQADGAEIMTVEGLAKDGKLHPIQVAFQEHHGLQCGFCTPGQLMTAYHLLKENPAPTEEQAREAMAGVLCRCTGYKQVIDSVMAAAAKMRGK
jgi:carbon-monoxide dehydrogenase small subunit